jgi:cold shock CspA family protein
MLVVLVGLAPLADAQQQNSRTVTGTVNFVNVGGEVVRMNPDGGGAELRIITTGVPAETWKSLKKGDRITARVYDIPGRAPLVQARHIGLTTAAAADTQNSRTVTGTVNFVNVGGEVVRMNPDGGGAELRIITTGVDGATWKSLKKGDKITARVHDIPGRAPLVQAETIGLAGSASSSGSWQQIHGFVRDVEGSTLRLQADDGRHLTVDMARVGTEIQKNLQRGDRVTVAATEVSGNHVRAEFIQKDSSAGVQPSASPSQPVNEKDWQKIHGKVTSVEGARLMLKADDGRDLVVHMGEVNPAVQKALTPGEGVTVAGFYRGDDKNVHAKFIQQDSSAK